MSQGEVITAPSLYMRAGLHLSEIFIKNSREHFKSNTETEEDRFVSVIPFSSWLRPSPLPARQDGHNVFCVLASGLLGREDTIENTHACAAVIGWIFNLLRYTVGCVFSFWMTGLNRL